MKKLATLRATLLRLVLISSVLLGMSSAQAHHSFALFDLGKLTTVKGTVTEWKWANPHTWLMLDVTKADGTIEKWAFVGSSPNMMSRWGWNAADVAAGIEITVDIHAARDGQRIGSLKNLFLPNGKVLTDPGGSSGRDLAAGPTNVPSEPQGEAYQ